MTRAEIETRWGLPFHEVARSIADQGLSIRHAGEILGMHRDTLRRLVGETGEPITFEHIKVRSDIALREGMTFWRYVAIKADEGLSRMQVAALVNQSYKGFMHTVEQNPDKDPFPERSVAREWLKDTGETIVSTSRRLAANGYCLTQAARVIGYKHASSLRDALDARGASIAWPNGRRVKR
jgi:hypothetical protein